jgi:hypothetical protein
VSRRLLFVVGSVVAVATPFVLWGARAASDQLVLAGLRDLDPPIPVLAETAEDPTRPPAAWLLVAVHDPDLFRDAAHFCRRHTEHPLPNCRNLLVADEIDRLLPPRFPLEVPRDAR